MPPYSMGAQTLNGCIGHEEVGGTSRQQLRRKYAHKIDVEVFNLPGITFTVQAILPPRYATCSASYFRGFTCSGYRKQRCKESAL